MSYKALSLKKLFSTIRCLPLFIFETLYNIMKLKTTSTVYSFMINYLIELVY